ncbi:exo-alpha-sialidase [candidate division KSB1 bacterium]|nr:exo-alpha-sialidase [candidate division KSB1 bacterium]
MTRELLNTVFKRLVLVLIFILMACAEQKPQRSEQGLIGAYYGNADLTRIKQAETLPDLNRVWDEAAGSGHGSSWSGKYQGFIIAPVSADITFRLETNRQAALSINGCELKAGGEGAAAECTLTMKKDFKYDIDVTYLHTQKGMGYLGVLWSWPGQQPAPVPGDHLLFTEAQADKWNYTIEPDPATIDASQFKTVAAEHVMVFDEPGRFGGWPANNGIWIWGDEIVVGFVSGYYLASDLHHSIDKDKPQQALLARSPDGGETWRIEDPDNYVGDHGEPLRLTAEIQFTHPDFAMRCSNNQFYYSYDRCRTWSGPFLFPDFGREKLTARTDYLVTGDRSCLVFLSTEEETVQAQLQDWAFCAETIDGGENWQFLSWMAEPDVKRAVMPSTVRIASGHLITALRRRYDKPFPNKPPKPQNWIDVYESTDNGRSWSFLSKVADTDRGKRNGNPPCLVKLADGRLAVTYAFRSIPYGIRAKISDDDGKTWSEEIHLRDDARTWDIGYTRSVQRGDGKMVTVYYYTTDDHPEQHIAATIWQIPSN